MFRMFISFSECLSHICKFDAFLYMLNAGANARVTIIGHAKPTLQMLKNAMPLIHPRKPTSAHTHPPSEVPLSLLQPQTILDAPCRTLRIGPSHVLVCPLTRDESVVLRDEHVVLFVRVLDCPIPRRPQFCDYLVAMVVSLSGTMTPTRMNMDSNGSKLDHMNIAGSIHSFFDAHYLCVQFSTELFPEWLMSGLR